jgi:hypothetical protein
MIVFVHIERTGGSKVHGALEPYFDGRVTIFNGAVDIRSGLATALEQPDRRWYLGGHIRFANLGPFLKSRQPSDVLFSTTRDPLDRAMSLYFLTRRSPDWLPELAPFAQRSFADFYAAAVDCGMLYENSQCQCLANSKDWRETVKVIRQHYNLVGTYRYYPQFLQRLEHVLEADVPGLRFDDSWTNTAYHLGAAGGIWERRFDIDELVDLPTRRRIEREHDGDYALVEFIESRPGAVLSPGDGFPPSSPERRWSDQSSGRFTRWFTRWYSLYTMTSRSSRLT